MLNKPYGAISLTESCKGRIDERLVRECAEKMKKSGLAGAGFTYLIIGDEWCECRVEGNLICDKARFPGGLGTVSEYLHGMGIKLGILTSAGVKSINGRPGSLDNEFKDARFFDREGVDLILHDSCGVPLHADLQTIFRRMGIALRSLKREINYTAFCRDERVHLYARSAGMNAFTRRIYSEAGKCLLPFEESQGYSGDYCFEFCGISKLDNDTDPKVLFRDMAVSSMMNSPVIIDCDLLSLDESYFDILSNKELFSIQQDEEMRPARIMEEDTGTVLIKLLESGYAFALVNDTDEEKTMNFYSYDFGLQENSGLIFTGYDVSDLSGIAPFDTCYSVSVESKECRLFRVRLEKKSDCKGGAR